MSTRARFFSATAVLVSLLAGSWAAHRAIEPPSPRSRWLASLRQQRLAEGRLSWQTDDVLGSGASAGPPLSPRERVSAESEILAMAEPEGSPGALADLALVHLAAGRIGLATEALERAVRLDPGDARRLSDLAAVYLERARPEDGFADWVLALATADNAVETDPDLPYARFNRALALQSLTLAGQAREAWLEYLELDPRSGWAEQAREHLATLDRPTQLERWRQEGRAALEATATAGDEQALLGIVAELPQHARAHVEEELLGVWAEATGRQRTPDSTRALAMARRVASALAARGERLPLEAVEAIDEARTANDAGRLAALAEGHLAYRQGRWLYGEGRLDLALPLFERARGEFEWAGSPVAEWAALHLAIARYQVFDLAPALDALERLIDRIEKKRFPALLGRAYWMKGLVELAGGEPAGSLVSRRTALEIFEAADARSEAGAVHLLLAENYRYLGDERQALRHLMPSLVASAESGEPRPRQNALNEAAWACLEAGHPKAAVAFRTEAVHVAQASGNPIAHTHALLRRAEALLRLGDVEWAAVDLEQADGVIPGISDADQRNRVSADLGLAKAELEAIRDPLSAHEIASDSLRFYREKGDHYSLGRLYLTRARIALAAGRTGEAEEDLAQGIAEYEELRRRVPDEPRQAAFFDRSRELFDEIVRLRADQDRTEEAFDAAEREHARSLLDRLDRFLSREQRKLVLTGVGEPLGARQILLDLPSETVILAYSLLPDHLYAWALSERGIAMAEREIRLPALEGTIEGFRRDLAGGGDAARATATAAELYDLLIRPLSAHLRPEELLVVVPDRALHSVPFAALLDRRHGRHLVEDHPIAFAPSATFYLRSLMRARELAGGGAPTVLAVGNPRFDRRFAPGLTDLPGAEVEASAVAELFPGSEVLAPDRATRATFLGATSRHAIVHFAGHAVANPEHPLLSHLVLAPDGEHDTGLLYAHALYGIHFERTRLAVLAACSTGAGPAAGEGVESLARAFLAAGVPAVVASLWEVDDRATDRLFRIFYRHLHEGRDAAEALQTAQLIVAKEQDDFSRSVSIWAGLQLFGHLSPQQ